MFRRSFGFRRKKAGDGEPASDPDQGVPPQQRRSEASLSPAATLVPSRSPSPGASSVSSQGLGGDEAPRRRRDTSASELPSGLRPLDASAQDPLGLRVIHRPQGGACRVDVVFVHGLGGSSRMTWSKNRDLELFWPLRFLPQEQDIREARILTFGYNSSFRFGSGKTKMSVLDFAKDLLYELKYGSEETEHGLEDLRMGERPILFVVHSMGGLIVKEAYMQGLYDPAYQPIVQAVAAIAFLSTPHRGTNLAESLNRILQVSFVGNPKQFIADLAAGSHTLQKLNEQFRHVASKLQIVSFYETRPTPVLRKSQMMVLEKDSSVLGYPGEISKPLDADHHGVCKYESRDDPLYRTVRNVLRNLINSISAKATEETPTGAAPTTTTTAPNFQELLSVPEGPDGDYSFFRDRWTPGTCAWILDHPAFRDWISDAGGRPRSSRVLWVTGSAATGKSILSSFVINHIVEQGRPCHYFFLRFASQEKRGTGRLLRSLACQLAHSHPAYADQLLRQLEAAGADLKTTDYKLLWQWLFRQALFPLRDDASAPGGGRPLYWVVDGLDEADRPASIVKLFSELHQSAVPIRVLAVGRRTHELTAAFQRLAKQVPMDTVLAEGHPVDIRSYVDYEMDLAAADDPAYRQAVAAQLLERARGNFLWVHLAVRKINACHTRDDVERALEELPPGMEALYDRMAAAVEAAQQQKQRGDSGGRRLGLGLGPRILAWVTYSPRPLTVDELRDALGGGDSEGVLEMQRTVAELCGGFVTVDSEEKVTMIHETARSYLMKGAAAAKEGGAATSQEEGKAVTSNDKEEDEGNRIAGSGSSSSRGGGGGGGGDDQRRRRQARGARQPPRLVPSSRAAHDLMFRRCVERLTDPLLRGQIHRNRPPALLHYATTSWAHHLCHSSVAADPEVQGVAARFLKSPHLLTWIYSAARAGELRALVVASRYLADVAVQLRRRRGASDDDDDAPPMAGREAEVAAEGWATDLVKVVGKFGHNLVRQPDSIYKSIPPFCPRDSMLYQLFGRREAGRALRVSGIAHAAWDDCLARLSLEPGAVASAVVAAGSGRIVLLAATRRTSQLLVYRSATFEEERRLVHPERVLAVEANRRGDLLVSYGYVTTRVWDLATGACLRTVANPRSRPRPHSILFVEAEKHGTAAAAVVVCGDDRGIREFSLGEDAPPEWTLRRQIREEGIDHAFVSFPTCAALSPDGTMVAFGYRAHPLTVWDWDPGAAAAAAAPTLVGRCYIRIDDGGDDDDGGAAGPLHDRSFGEVFQVAWHPLGGEVFGLDKVGLLFRWNPYEEEAHATVRTDAHRFALSRDGSLVATGDGMGTVKVYSAAASSSSSSSSSSSFSLLYRLTSQDPVNHLAFSVDARRVYDVRGTYGNVWEPNTLVRLAEFPDPDSDAASDTESLAKSSLQAIHHHHVSRVGHVTSVAAQPSSGGSSLYCYGTEDGYAVVGELGKTRVGHSERLASYMPVEAVAWSPDGRHVALADLGGRLTVKQPAPPVGDDGEHRDAAASAAACTWTAPTLFDLVLPPERGQVTQLLFHGSGRRLFAFTPTTIFVVAVESGRLLQEARLDANAGTMRWALHPHLADALLGFGETKMLAFRTVDELGPTGEFPYASSGSEAKESSLDPPGGGGRRALGRLISAQGQSQMLLKRVQTGAAGLVESQYLLFDVGDVDLREKTASSGGGALLPYATLPPDIASRIREPLALLSRGRLAFLDVDRWVCTWRLPTTTTTGAGKQGDASSTTTTLRVPGPSPRADVEEHYFLPGDWVTSQETPLCTMTSDGILLCPRNGEIAVVQASRIRK